MIKVNYAYMYVFVLTLSQDQMIQINNRELQMMNGNMYFNFRFYNHLPV